MNMQVYDSAVAVAEAAAEHAVHTLHNAIITRGHAVWVLAGGSTPNLAYAILANDYLDRLDWSKITFVIGDERIGPLNGPDNNWQVIEELLLQHVPEATFIRPKSDLSAEEAAQEYTQRLVALPSIHNTPLFDLVWLGMGPDGHTLSLFPEHSDFNPSDSHLVIPVHNSPKPPADRISLTLHAIANSKNTVIIATGVSKRDALKQAFATNSTLPVALAAKAQPTTTLWLLDEAANP